jgi:hypothetical protein
MSHTLRPLVPVVAVALLCTALLHGWIRAQPLAMPRAAQAVLGAALVAVVAIVLALVQHVERDLRDAEDR